jgi:hypothetical protein
MQAMQHELTLDWLDNQGTVEGVFCCTQASAQDSPLDASKRHGSQASLNLDLLWSRTKTNATS